MGGASPIEAIQLQIVVMNFLIGASTVSSIMSTYLCWPSFFTAAYQLETAVFAAAWFPFPFPFPFQFLTVQDGEENIIDPLWFHYFFSNV